MSTSLIGTAAMPVRAAIYLRISRDDDTTTHLGVSRQLLKCRAMLKKLGWTEVLVVDENDTSATKATLRKKYESMVAQIRAGEIDAVIVYQQDRLTRKPEEIEALLKTGVRFATSTAGEIMMDDPDSKYGVRIAAAGAAREVEVTGLRVKDAAEQRAAAGKAHGPAPFGWSRRLEFDRTGKVTARIDTLYPPEAELLNWAARELLDRKSLRSVTAVLAAGEVQPRGVKGRPATWSSGQLRALLLRPANVSQRVYRGEVLEDVTADWPPLFAKPDGSPDKALFDSLRALFADPTRRSNDKGSAPAWLLSGLSTCSVCPDGGRIQVNTGGTKRRRPAYTCVGKPGVKGCFQRHWVDDVDDWIGNLVEERLADPALADPGPEVQDELTRLYSEIDELKAQGIEAGKLAALRKISLAQLTMINEQNEADILDLETRAKSLLPHIVGEIAPGGWSATDLTTQRALVRSLFESIEFVPSPVNGRYRVFDPDEIRHVYRGGLR